MFFKTLTLFLFTLSTLISAQKPVTIQASNGKFVAPGNIGQPLILADKSFLWDRVPNSDILGTYVFKCTLPNGGPVDIIIDDREVITQFSQGPVSGTIFQLDFQQGGNKFAICKSSQYWPSQCLYADNSPTGVVGTRITDIPAPNQFFTIAEVQN